MNKTKLLIDARVAVAFHPELAELFGVNGALYVQQLYYWSDKGSRKDGFIYKTKDELQEETFLTRFKQDRIRKELEKKGVVETKLIKANGVPTLHYKLNVHKLNEMLVQKRLTDTENSDVDGLTDTENSDVDGQGGLVRNLPTGSQETYQSGDSKFLTIPITENTQENTTDTTSQHTSVQATPSLGVADRKNPTEPASAEPVEFFLGDRTEPARARTEPVQSLPGVPRVSRPPRALEQTLPSDQTQPVEQARQEKEKNSAQKEKEKNSAQKEKEIPTGDTSSNLLVVSVWQYTGRGNGRTVRRFMHPDEYDRLMELDDDEYTSVETITQTHRIRKMRAKPKHITILYEGEDEDEPADDLTAYATIKYQTGDDETSVVNVNEEQYRTIRDSVNSGASRIQFISLPIKSKTGVVQPERSISFWASNIKNITVIKR